MVKKALMACHNHWTSPFQVGSHHIARELVNLGFEVAFLSAPVSPLHVLGGASAELTERYKIYRSGGRYDLDGKLWYYVPGALLTPQNRPLLKTAAVANYWHKTCRHKIEKLLSDKGFGEVDLIYFDNCYYSFLLDKLKYGKSIFRIADKNSGFASATEQSNNLETGLARRVDHVIYTAHCLEEYVGSMTPKSSIFLPNGVFFDHFAKAPRELPEEYSSIPRPIVLYVGAISEWFDFEIVNVAARKMPGVSFVFIGPERNAREKVAPAANVFLLGSRSYKQIPKYMSNADIGIIPFDFNKYPALVNSIHPLKLYEYMACGLPVIAARWRELELMDSPARLYSNEIEFIAAIDETIQNLPHLDKAGFVDYASKHDWRSKVKELIEKVGIKS